MTHRTFGNSLSGAALAFVMYCLSLISALSWSNAVQDFIKNHDRKWARWVFAAAFTVFALLVIAVIVVFSGNDDDNDNNAVSRSPSIGGNPV